MCFARKGFTGDEPTQASIHLLCKLSELNLWTNFCDQCLLQRPTWLRALQCSRDEMECNFAAQATLCCNRDSLACIDKLFDDESGMWLSCQHFLLHTVPLWRFFSSVSPGYSSWFTDRQQPGMIIGDHNLSEKILVAFISGCCAFSITRRSQRKIKCNGISI